MADLSDVAPGALPPKTHNNPPSDLEMLGESLTLRHVATMRQAEDYVRIVGQMPDHFTTAGEAEYVTNMIKLMQNLQKHIDSRRKAEKEPFLRNGEYVDDFFNKYRDDLAAACVKAKLPLDDWMKSLAEAEKKQRESDFAALVQERNSAIDAAARAPLDLAPERIDHALNISQAARVAEALVTQPITSLASVTAKGSKAGLVEQWRGTITSTEQLDIIKLRPYISLKELEAALARYVKAGGRDLQGAEIKMTIETKVK